MTDRAEAERYVAGQMNDTEVAEFEAKMLERPDLAADVGVRHRIKAGLELLEERNELAPLLVEKTRRRPVMQYALAASVAVAVLIGATLSWRGNLAGTDGVQLLASLPPQSSMGVETIKLAAMRGRPAPEKVDLKIGGPPVLLRIMPDGSASGPFTIEFAGERSQAVTAADGFVEIYLRGAGPLSGELPLTLEPAQGNPQSFPILLTVHH